jgi:hypothetical protein
MNWAAYLERKFTISENITAEMKRKQKRLRKVGSHGFKAAFFSSVWRYINMLGFPVRFFTLARV